MTRYKNFQPTDNMNKINLEQISKSSAEFLELIQNNNEGLIIKDEKLKDNQIICSAKWFEYCFDDDFGLIVNSALRYSIRRLTYMPMVVRDFIRKYIKVLDFKTITNAIRDIEYEIEIDNNLEDLNAWISFRNELSARAEEIQKMHEDEIY